MGANRKAKSQTQSYCRSSYNEYLLYVGGGSLRTNEEDEGLPGSRSALTFLPPPTSASRAQPLGRFAKTKVGPTTSEGRAPRGAGGG